MDMIAFDIFAMWSQYVWPILLFLIGLSLVVFVHELGHFLAAKWAGVMVEKFAIGFGPRLIGRKWGETEYRINIIPLGGYVGMLGQDDANPAATSDDPRSWQKAKPGKKLVILSAGVVMNVIWAAVVFVIVYMVGIRFVAPVVGGTTPGMPAAEVVLPAEVAQAMGVEKAVGLLPGDRVLAINGKPIRKFDELKMAAGLSKAGEAFELSIARPVGSGTIEFDVTMEPKRKDTGEVAEKYGPQFMFGIASCADVVIAEAKEEGYAKDARFEKGDRILQLSGRPVANPWDMQALLRSLAGQQIDYLVERKGAQVTVPVTPHMILSTWEKYEHEQLELLGMSPRVFVADKVDDDTPAGKAGMAKGDVIVSYAGHDAPSQAELMALSKQFVDKEVPIRVLRDGKVLDLKVTPEKEGDKALIGFAPLPEQNIAHVAEVYPKSATAKAGLPENVVLTEVNDTPVATWAQAYAALRDALGKKVSISYRQDGIEHTVKIGTLTVDVFDSADYTFLTPSHVPESVMTDPVRGDPIQAIKWSVEDTWRWMSSVYTTIRRIITGRVSPKGISGPVGIGVIAVRTARKSGIHLVYFMAMISSLVAVFNFLPLPMLDGGHAVLAVIEKIRGRPLPTRLLVWIHTAGFILIIALFVAITFQDIMRWIF